MKHLIILFSVLLSALCSFSQITIGQNDLPQAGSTYQLFFTENVSGDYAAAGSNKIWDFSNLTTIGSSETSFLANTGLPFTLAIAFNSSTMHTAFGGFDTGFELPIESGYQFFSNSFDGYKINGFGINFSGLGIPLSYDTPDLIYKFPLNYNLSYTSNSSLELNIPNIVYYSSEIDRYSIVDGWGTLYLPSDTLEVLRVKQIINRIDSFFVDTIGSVPAIPSTSTVYSWLAVGKGMPVLEITETDFIVTANFMADPGSVGIRNNTSERNLSIFPNPAKNFTLLFNTQPGSDIRVNLIDTQGRLIEQLFSGKANSSYFNQHFRLAEKHPKGLYFLRIEIDQEVMMKKIVKE